MVQGHEVVVVGAGPTGMMLAGELALAGVDVGIVERRETQEVVGSRALGLLARTLEVLDQRGLAERFVAAGTPAQVGTFAGTTLDISAFPARYPHGLGLVQARTEALLAAWIAELGVPVHRGVSVTGFADDGAGVDVALDDGATLRAGWLVGCDGGRSVVRRTAGIAFEGWDASATSLLGEVELRDEPELGVRRDAHGVYAIGPVEGAATYRFVLREEGVGRGEPTFEEVRGALVALYGTDFGAHSPRWLSRFGDASRQAAAYRAGRVLLAGDAAHVHSPVGGQGMGTGMQDAVNLGWKLGLVVRGVAGDELLDTYAAERRPVGARVLQLTMALTALNRLDDRMAALRDVLDELLVHDAPRTALAGRMSGLDLHYDLGPGHPLLGRRMPDLDLADGTRVAEHLRAARPVLLTFGSALDARGWADRVRVVDAAYGGAWELPVLGVVDPPSAVLVRPDGHVAWVGAGSPAGLADALARWFGPPTR